MASDLSALSHRRQVAALVVAAGSGERAGGGVPKQYRRLAGRSVLERSLAALDAPGLVQSFICVIREEDEALYRDTVLTLPPALRARLLPPARGGSSRQQSVLAGLEALAASDWPDIVLVHDAARPFLQPAIVGRAIEAAALHGAAVPAVPVIDTIKRVDAESRIVETPDRAELRAVQTPQAFAFPSLLAAHRDAASKNVSGLTDDAAVIEWAGGATHVFEGDRDNMKLTTASDFAEAERRLALAGETRVGSGYDVHAFGPGSAVMLGGIEIAHDRALAGHSDADVVLHAITDAILGALADGDIGSHFPPSDPQWRGASSDRFLSFAVERLRARSGRLNHVDVTIICEAPRIGPHRDAMRERIAAICAIPASRVGVKATTSEQLGFTGRREGIAAHAVATVVLPAEAP